jgi:hypothetical protein
MRRRILKSVVVAVLLSLGTVRTAFAYVDPNVGGMLFQALAAGFAVLSGILLLFSRQIRTLLGRLRRARNNPDEPIEQTPSQISTSAPREGP